WASRRRTNDAVRASNRSDPIPSRRRVMHLSVTGHHVEITPALRAYVEKKLERIVRHFDHVIDVHCVLTVEKLRQSAEATLHVSRSAIHANDVQANMYAAI